MRLAALHASISARCAKAKSCPRKKSVASSRGHSTTRLIGRKQKSHAVPAPSTVKPNDRSPPHPALLAGGRTCHRHPAALAGTSATRILVVVAEFRCELVVSRRGNARCHRIRAEAEHCQDVEDRGRSDGRASFAGLAGMGAPGKGGLAACRADRQGDR